MSGSDVFETRPSKRARLSADGTADYQAHSANSSTSSVKLRRHPELWFDDGNIVLVACETAFRIYRGLLAGQSTVFADMFAASSSSSEETFDDCPVVHLSDSAHDLEHLLRLLLPQSRIHYRTTRMDSIRPFDELSAVIRLAHKYNIPQIQDQALVSLEEYGFVSSFAAYSRASPNSQLESFKGAYNIGVVNLARLTDTPSLLPLALYECAYLGSAVLDGWTHEDGTIEYLSHADLRRCIDAHVALINERTFCLSQLFDDTANEGCGSPDTCLSSLRLLHRNLVRSEELARSLDVLTDWAEAVKKLKTRGALCSSCTEELLERNETERKKVFDKLPKIFDIVVEGWGTGQVESGAALE